MTLHLTRHLQAVWVSSKLEFVYPPMLLPAPGDDQPDGIGVPKIQATQTHFPSYQIGLISNEIFPYPHSMVAVSCSSSKFIIQIPL